MNYYWNCSLYRSGSWVFFFLFFSLSWGYIAEKAMVFRCSSGPTGSLLCHLSAGYSNFIHLYCLFDVFRFSFFVVCLFICFSPNFPLIYNNKLCCTQFKKSHQFLLFFFNILILFVWVFRLAHMQLK